MGFFMPFFLLIIFFLFVPFFQMLAKSFSTGSGQLGFSWYVEIFTKTSYLVAIKNSIWTVSYTHLYNDQKDYAGCISFIGM